MFPPQGVGEVKGPVVSQTEENTPIEPTLSGKITQLQGELTVNTQNTSTLFLLITLFFLNHTNF